MRKRIMTVAWQLAKQGARKYGGSSKDYIAEALRIVWEVSRSALVRLPEGSRKHKTWVARINGKCDRYGFEREFVLESDIDGRTKVFALTPGVYEICEAGDRRFVKVENGIVKDIDVVQVA